MASRRSTAIVAALTSKGFVDTGGDHHWLVLHVEGKKTAVRTKVSRGHRDYGDPLLSAMSKQLKLEGKKARLLDLLDCPMSESDYIADLRQRGVLGAEGFG